MNNHLELAKNLNILTMHPFTFHDIIIEVINVQFIRHPNFTVISDHIHPFFEFNLLVEGDLYTNINGDEFYVAEKKCFLVPPGITHNHRKCNYDSYSDICIHFSIKPTTSKSDATYFSHFYNNLMHTAHSTFDGKLEKIYIEKNLFSAQITFLSWLTQLTYLPKNNTNIRTNKSEHCISESAIKFMEMNYFDDINTNDISRALNISYRSLARHFKEETGVSLTSQLNVIRVSHAKKLLLSTNFSLSEIAKMTGFDNEHYFSFVFRKYTFTSPHKFRQKKAYVNGELYNANNRVGQN